jgi:hypothetical protein
MANVDAPFGLRPISNLDGAPYNGATIKCVILGADTTDTFVGDAVDFGGSSDALGLYPSIVQHAAGGPITGVITSFVTEPGDLTLQYASGAQTTDRVANVCLAYNQLFEIQCDDNTLAATDIGEAGDIVVGAGSTVTGMSGMELNTSDVGTGDTLVVLGIVRTPENALGDGVGLRVRVRVNESHLHGVGTPV